MIYQKKIEKIRQNINTIDDQLIILLSKRLSLVKTLANFKLVNKLKDPRREAEIINRLSAQSSLNKNFIKQIYSKIFAYSIKELKILLKNKQQ